MIAFVRGTLIEKHPTRVVVQMSGMGMEVLVPVSTFERLPECGQDVLLHTHLHVREDALILVGFTTTDEKELFLLLLSVSGIGIKLALSILSGCKPIDLYRFIAEGQEAALTRIPGLGKKTAQRIILDLKDKAASQLGKMNVDTTLPARRNRALLEEAIQAMTALGYSRPEASRAIEKAGQRLGEEASIEDLLRAALQG
jgi:holliday junction DNA helicase RuvA